MIRYYIILHLCLISSLLNSQTTFLPNKNGFVVGISPRYLIQIDNINQLRKQDANSYIYNKGFGGTIIVPLFLIKKKIPCALEFGEYYFWNNNLDKDNQNINFTKRGYMIPILFSSGFGLINTKKFGLMISLGAGLSYNQRIIKYSQENVINRSSTSFCMSINLKADFKNNSILQVLSTGYGNLYSDNSYFKTVGMILPVPVKF